MGKRDLETKSLDLRVRKDFFQRIDRRAWHVRSAKQLIRGKRRAA